VYKTTRQALGEGRKNTMNTQSVLRDLGVSDGDLSETQKQQLDRDGYFIIENALSEADCERMKAEIERITAQEGDSGGGEVSIEAGVTRISNVFNKTDAFDVLLFIKPMLAAGHYLLGEFKVHGANMREPHKGTGRQPLHSDSVKLADGGWCLANSLITFDPMTLDNGPTRIVPGSHRWAPLNVPGENAMGMGAGRREKPAEWAREGENVSDYVAQSEVDGDDDRKPTDPFATYPGEIKVTVPARSLVFCNAHMWHSGTMKNTEARRRQLHLSLTRRELDQQLNQRAYATAALLERVSPAQRFLLDI
jgi:ectoine hydroxylase-related dioxygenase (phytanoyl-CoA dioxygenase family)